MLESIELSKCMLSILNASLDGQVSFIQIGGNDGVLTDPITNYIKEFKWNGIIVEPVPEYFLKLKDNYKNYKNVECINIAIDSVAENKIIYKVMDNYIAYQKRVTGGIYFLQGIASFSKEHLLKHGVPEEFIGFDHVRSIRGDKLVNDYYHSKCDLLVIDVEGSENSVLSSFDLNILRPKVILIETVHMSLEDLEFLYSLLYPLNYEIFKDKYDSIAVLRPD